jgi:hypothetical protein
MGHLLDIHGFKNLASIGGDLFITSDFVLTNLDGFNNLSTVGGAFSLFKDNALLNIGFNSLMSIGENLIIISDPALTDIAGLNNLISVGGLIELSDNSALTNISGLNGLTTIGSGKLSMNGNDVLAHIDGFNALTSYAGDFKASGMPHLLDIKGFKSLTSIGGALFITSDFVLTNLDGFNNLSTVGGAFSLFKDNALLNIGFNSLMSIGENLIIISDPALTDIAGLNNLISVGGLIELSDNSALTNISGLNGLTTIGSGKLSMNGNDVLAHIDGFNALTSYTGDFKASGMPHLLDIKGFKSLTSIGGALFITSDFVLTNIDGLNNLSTIGGDLSFYKNKVIVNMGFNGLTSIGGTLVIGGSNDALINLDALSNLATVGDDLIVEDNTHLNNFCGLLTLFKNNGLAGSYEVIGNATNPTKQQLIDASNQAPVISDVTANPTMLAPPNHKMRDVAVNYTSTDNCGVESCSLIVTSNEPINGTADGDTDPDWEVVDDHHVKLRAERAANGSGRIYTITVTCIDHQGNASTKTVEVRVAHNITGPVTGKPFKVGSTVDFAGEFWDKPTNKHTAKWLIDDNTTVKGVVTEPTSAKNGKVTGSYKFTSPGVYKLQMNTIDQNNVTTYANTNGDVEEIIVIYDPNGGYAYGGGYFNSPAGALKSNPTATGKVSYGFAMNYFKNATLPKGETQFEFKIGDFEYNAVNFDYLSISGAKAQFKGTGKIVGGQSGINFIMTVIDGDLDGTGIDKVRMKIYNKNTGQIYYDNQPGASDAANPIAAVGLNSSIVVQNTAITSTQKEMITEEVTQNVKELEVKAMPNPSNNNFTLKVRSNNLKDKIVMQVIDMYGRVIEIRNVAAEQTIRLGDKYSAGTYIVRFIQGDDHKQLRLVKLSN